MPLKKPIELTDRLDELSGLSADVTEFIRSAFATANDGPISVPQRIEILRAIKKWCRGTEQQAEALICELESSATTK